MEPVYICGPHALSFCGSSVFVDRDRDDVSPSWTEWTTVSKIRGIMHRIYKVGILHERVWKNPVAHVETRSRSLYKAVVITPSQTLTILNQLTSPLHFTLVLTCAATALRASEIVSLRWSDILWTDGQIR